MNTTMKALNLNEMGKVSGGGFYDIMSDVLLCTLGGPVGQMLVIIDHMTDNDGEKSAAETGRRSPRT